MIFFFAVAPIITIDPQHPQLVIHVGDSLRLFCTAKGLPIPEILWYKGSAPILQPLPQLYLVPTKFPHSTNYTCVATNKVGNESSSIFVIVEGIFFM